MADQNKRNLLYFEGSSMRELYNSMERWQTENNRRLLSLNVQKDSDTFCCIALINPTEVVICDGNAGNQAAVTRGCLNVENIY